MEDLFAHTQNPAVNLSFGCAENVLIKKYDRGQN
jgi:hypothetical protein